MRHSEKHRTDRIGWLRAAVLGANDGIVSTASLVVGVAAAETDRSSILLAGVAGLVAGAMSMAAGEYVSVSSQSDTENADIQREREELATMPEAELKELTAIYIDRGLDESLAQQVAEQLTVHDALGACERRTRHFRIHHGPAHASGSTSAATFAIGAALPLAATFLTPVPSIPVVVSILSLAFLALLGGISARAGGAPIAKAVTRVTFWGAIAMLATAGIGYLFGVAV